MDLFLSVQRKMFQLCGDAEGSIAADLLQCEMEVEGKVLAPLQSIDVSTFHMGEKNRLCKNYQASEKRGETDTFCFR